MNIAMSLSVFIKGEVFLEQPIECQFLCRGCSWSYRVVYRAFM